MTSYPLTAIFFTAGPVRHCRETSFYRVNVPGICLLKKGESTYSCKGINLTYDHHYHCLEFTRPIVTTARTNASCMTVCGKSVFVLVLIAFIYIHNAHLLWIFFCFVEKLTVRELNVKNELILTNFFKIIGFKSTWKKNLSQTVLNRRSSRPIHDLGIGPSIS